MGKKKNGHKQSAIRKYAKMFVKYTGVAAGVSVAASPVISAGAETFGGTGGFSGKSFKAFTEQVQRNYGRDPSTGAIDVGKAVTNGVIVPMIGVGIMWGFNQIARRI